MMTDDDAALFDKLSDELIRYASMLVGPSGAHDVLVNAALRAFASPAWPTIENRRAYLYRAILHEASNQRRAAQRRMIREQRAAEPEAWEPSRLAPEMTAALLRLTVRQRSVVFLTYWLDRHPDEIAVTLDISLRTVERELTRARHRLKVLLQ